MYCSLIVDLCQTDRQLGPFEMNHLFQFDYFQVDRSLLGIPLPRRQATTEEDVEWTGSWLFTRYGWSSTSIHTFSTFLWGLVEIVECGWLHELYSRCYGEELEFFASDCKRCQENIKLFKKHLKTHYFSLAYPSIL